MSHSDRDKSSASSFSGALESKGGRVYQDPASRELLARIERLAPSEATVLITGETGTGKELVARQLHAGSRRADRPFIAVNAGALPETLAESELFGHEKGSFTGAHASKAGWFEAADGGTLFLDEIGDLPLSLQVKLLRVLQEGEVTRIGARHSIPVDVRLLAATNIDLHGATRAKLFREDLFYRLKVATIALPPLRERRGDILALAWHFLATYERRLGQSGARLGSAAAQRLLQHDWPGNVRELENAIHHALLVRQGDEIRPQDLQLGTSEAGVDPAHPEGPLPELAELERVMFALLDRGVPELNKRVEATLLAATYRYCGHNQLETARRLGLSRNVVRARLIDCGALKGTLRRRSESTLPAGAVRTTSNASWGFRKIQPSFRIGYQKLGLLMLVKGYGAFDAALAARGVHVEWIEFAGGIQLVDALRARALDAAVMGDAPAVVAQAHDVPIVYVAAEPPAPRGTALIVPPLSRARSVADLRGKRVAVNRAAQAHYLLIKALEEANVDPSDIEICFEPPDRALRAFQLGTIDAWAIWDPWLSSARLDFGGRILRDATGLLKNSAFYLARRDFAERQPELIEELLRHVHVAAQWVKRDPARAAHMIAPDLGLSSQALIASLERELRTSPLSAEVIAAQQDVADTLLRLKLIPRAVSVADAQWRLELAV